MPWILRWVHDEQRLEFWQVNESRHSTLKSYFNDDRSWNWWKHMKKSKIDVVLQEIQNLMNLIRNMCLEITFIELLPHIDRAKELRNHMHVITSLLRYIPRNMHTVFALLCFVVVIHWLIFPYPSGLLHWHCGNLTIAPVPAKQPWWIWINTSCECIMNDCTTTTKQSTTKPCAYY